MVVTKVSVYLWTSTYCEPNEIGSDSVMYLNSHWYGTSVSWYMFYSRQLEAVIPSEQWKAYVNLIFPEIVLVHEIHEAEFKGLIGCLRGLNVYCQVYPFLWRPLLISLNNTHWIWSGDVGGGEMHGLLLLLSLAGLIILQALSMRKSLDSWEIGGKDVLRSQASPCSSDKSTDY